MSAYLVNRAHIDALVTYALEHSIHPKPEGSVLGRLLWGENAKSVRHRYDDAAEIWPEVETTEAYEFDPGYVSQISIVKACHCYAYQSCEHPGWDTSTAKRVIDVIEQHALQRLGVTYKQLSESGPHGPRNAHAVAYDEAPGWDLQERDLQRDRVAA